MNLKQLTYFLKIVESRSMTRAANILHIAQPALSQQVAQLEQEFGTRLLSRSVHGVSPTDTGMLLYRHAKSIMRQVEVTETVLRQSASNPTGKVALALPSSTARLVAIPLLRETRARYPGISLELMESPTADLAELVLHGRVDLAITIGNTPSKGLVALPMLVEELYIITHPDAAFPENVLSVDDLRPLKFVLPGPPNTIRSTIERVFAEADASLEVIAELSATSLLVAATLNGLGATVLPWSAVHDEAARKEIRLSGLKSPKINRQLSLCHAEFLALSPACELIAALLFEQMHALVASGVWRGAQWIGAERVDAQRSGEEADAAS
jgi:LysR family nitrogen assimilation transcriptional regulator